MKKFLIALTVLTLAFFITKSFMAIEVENALVVYCIENPDALVCTDKDATTMELTVDMIDKMMTDFETSSVTAFCDEFFSQSEEGLYTDCINDINNILPPDFNELSSGSIDLDVSESFFTIESFFPNSESAYRFTVSVIDENGLLKITDFEYQVINIDLQLSESIVLEYLLDVSGSAFDMSEGFCATFFMGDALSKCIEDERNVIPHQGITFNPVVNQIGLNLFNVFMSSNDSLIAYEYIVEFEEVNEILYLKEVDLNDLSVYNNLENAEIFFTEFLEDFVLADDLNLFCEERIDGVSNISRCKGLFSLIPNYENNVISFDVNPEDQNKYSTNVDFIGVNGGNVEFELYIVVDEDSNYDIHLKRTDGIIDNDYIALAQVEDLMEFVLSESQDVTNHPDFCEEYISNTNVQLMADCEENRHIFTLYPNVYSIESIVDEGLNNFTVVTTRDDGYLKQTLDIKLKYNEDDQLVFSYYLAIYYDDFTEFNFDAYFSDYVRDYNNFDNISHLDFCSEYTAMNIFYEYFIDCYDEREESRIAGARIEYVGVYQTETTDYFDLKLLYYYYDKTIEETSTLDMYLGSLNDYGFDKSSNIYNDVTNTAGTIIDQIEDRFDEYLMLYFNQYITSEEMYDEFLIEHYNFESFKNIRNSDIASVESIDLLSVDGITFLDGYYVIRTEGIINYKDGKSVSFTKDNPVKIVNDVLKIYPLSRKSSVTEYNYTVTTDQAFQIISSAFIEYYQGDLVCSNRFSSSYSMDTQCEEDPISFFTDITVEELTLEEIGANQFILTLYYIDIYRVDRLVEIRTYVIYFDVDSFIPRINYYYETDSYIVDRVILGNIVEEYIIKEKFI